MLKVVLRFLRRSISHLPRVVPLGALLLLFLGATIVLVLRYSILPDIGRYHGDITAKVGQIIGQPVIIGKIEADWWGYRPRLKFIDVRFLDKNGQTALVLPRVDNVVSWLSLLTGEIRLYSLEIDQPDLLVKRDAQGVVHIAGVAMSDQVAGQTSELDWLLDQSRIAIHDARITWQDELRAAPPLVLTQVELIIENSVLFENLEFIRNSGLIENAGRRHRFALRAQPPVELSSKLDVRGDFDGESFVSLNLWSGQLYTQLDYGDVGTWNEWLTLPVGINSGRGAVRSWLGFEKGKVNQLTADIALEDIQARLAGDLPILDVREVRGRVGWKNITQAKEISTRNLSLLMTDGLQLESTDFFMRLNYAKDGQPPGGEIRTNMLELSKLASLAEFLPLGQEMRQQLTEFSPRGQISGLQLKWQGDASNSLHYEVKGRFNDISLNRVGEFPGFSGLTGQINGNDESGSLSLYSYNMSIDAPNVVVEPLAFDVFNAQFGWRRNERGLEVKFSNVSVANPDLAGNFAGKFQTLSHSPGEIDLTVHLSRVSVRHAYRYIPLVALHGSALAWVRDGFVDGQADEFDLRLQGDMKNFPFDRSDTGVFRIRARAKDVAVEYAQDWPRIENAIAELSIEGRHLKVTSPTAMTAGSNLQNISVVLPDMLGHDLVLQVSGEADDETMRGLDFIQQSPVRGYIDGFTDGATARGKGALRLNLGIPLSGDKPVSVSGNYRFIDSDLDLGRGKPTLTKTNGELLFTESSVRTRNLMAEIFGGPATLEVQTTEDGVMRAKISGRADMEVMRKQESYPLLHYLHGVSPWEAELTVQNKQVNLLLTSNLLGLTSDLPAPFSKRAKEPVSLRFEKKPVDDQKDMLSIKFGSIFTAQLLRHETDGSWDIKRGKVNFGREGKWPTRDGVVITGTIPDLSLEGWGALLSGKRDSASNDKPTAVNIIAIDLLIPKASGYGYKLDDLRISGRKRSEVLIVKLLSSALDGEMRWQPKGGGKLVAHIKNLVLDKDTIEGKQKNDKGKSGVDNERKNDDAFGQAKPAALGVKTEFPDLDLTVDNVVLNSNPLGKLEILAQQRGSEWVIDSIRLTNQDGLLTANGKWHAVNGVEQSQIKFLLEISNAGNILGRSGYPNSVKRGSGKLEGNFLWHGGPSEFSYAILDGSLKLDTGKGQFLKIDPGVGKLLGILSLQALPKHLMLDFADVFSKGFAFDSITGTAQIKQGLLLTNDFKIDGSASRVTMLGQVDLSRETQNLRIRILPTVGDSVSLLGAFAAGPAVGVGVFLANKLLRNPLDKLVSVEYNVTGTWIEPVVEKISGNKPAPAPNK